MTDDNTVDPVIHAGDDHLVDDNGVEKLGKTSHFQGLKLLVTQLLTLNNKERCL
jgi:hypothetical protein